MDYTIKLAVIFSTIEPINLLHTISKNLKPFNQKLPELITDGFEKYPGQSNWIDKIIPRYNNSVSVYWGTMLNHEGRIECDLKRKSIGIAIKNYELNDVKSLIKMLAPLPWTIASFAKIHKEWKKYRACCFDSEHISHGWACAFKGEGHNRLVSRRWLEYNPWHLIRDEEQDISFIQFHELDANPKEALSQAKPGHERMGFSDIGGFVRRDYLLKLEESNAENATVIYSDEGEEVGRGYLVDGGYNYEYFPQGLYNSNENKIEIVFVERELTERELLECCMIRYFQDLGTDKPVDKVAYVFVVPEEAQQHLHQLWLREIECWTFTEEGLKIRLDEDYQPTYEYPEWVQQLRIKQQQQEQQAKLDKVTTRLSQINKEMKRLDDRIKNLSGGSYDRSIHTRIKELKAQ